MNQRLGLLTLLCGLLSACTQTQAPPRQSLGMANPASAFCLAQGGSLSIKTTSDGDIGLCTLADGQVIEEWAYYRAHHSGS